MKKPLFVFIALIIILAACDTIAPSPAIGATETALTTVESTAARSTAADEATDSNVASNLSDYEIALQSAPQRMDEAHYRVGKFVLTSVDVYISGMITHDELGQSVFYARDSLSELGNGTTEYETGNILVSGQVLMLYNDLTYLDASDDELVSHRNLLADALGEPRS